MGQYSKLCSMGKNLVRRSLMTVANFVEVKGQQMSNVVIDVILLDVPLMQAKDADELLEDKRSS